MKQFFVCCSELDEGTAFPTHEEAAKVRDALKATGINAEILEIDYAKGEEQKARKP